MADRDWDITIWRRANDLLQQAERIHRNYLRAAAGASSRLSRRAPTWEPPINVVETDESLWVISAVPGVAADSIEVHLEGRDLVIEGNRPLPKCCEDGELKIWELPLGRFERRLRLSGEKNISVGETSLRDGLLIIEIKKRS